MDDDIRELANLLFATAAEMVEDASEVAIAGQSLRLNPSQLTDTGRRLQTAAPAFQPWHRLTASPISAAPGCPLQKGSGDHDRP